MACGAAGILQLAFDILDFEEPVDVRISAEIVGLPQLTGTCQMGNLGVGPFH
jgi:hypothetical protein